MVFADDFIGAVDFILYLSIQKKDGWQPGNAWRAQRKNVNRGLIDESKGGWMRDGIG